MNLVELVHRKRVERFWQGLAELIRRYFRLEVEGLARVPGQGGAIVAPNHSGYAGADAIMLAHLLHRETGRNPRILAHRAFFEWFRLVRLMSESFGLREASTENGIQVLRDGALMMIFPEGEAGNFKPSWLRYRLRRFHTGFVRMALLSGAPIVPCLVIGAEESHLNFGSLDLTRYVRGLRVPLPFNLFPLPAKWRIVFLPPVELQGYTALDADDPRKMKHLAGLIRARMQRELNHRLRRRKYVFFARGGSGKVRAR